MKINIKTVRGKTFINIGGCSVFMGEGAEGISHAFGTYKTLIREGLVKAFEGV